MNTEKLKLVARLARQGEPGGGSPGNNGDGTFDKTSNLREIVEQKKYPGHF
jgi:hypothetical protein